MRIAHVAWNFSPPPETFIYNYVVGVQQRGHESHVLTLGRMREKERPYEPVWTLDFPPRWLPPRVIASIRRRLGFVDIHEQFFPFARASAHKILQELQPDIIHAQFGPTGVLMAPLAQHFQIPLVVSFLGYDISHLLRTTRWQQHYQELAQTASAVIGVSTYTCSRLKEAGFPPENVHWVHLGVDTSHLGDTAPADRFDGKVVRCLHVGRLVPKKSPVRLVKAFARARRELLPTLDLRLTIVGGGRLYDQVRQTIQAEDVADAVELLGAVDHTHVMKLLRQAHIYTQHSVTAPDGDQEGQPVSLVEAAASGLPIVSTRHSGIPDVVLDGKTGYLVEEGDVDGMAARIAELARNPELWRTMGRAGRDHVEANLTLQQQIEKTLAIYEAILAQRGPRGTMS